MVWFPNYLNTLPIISICHICLGFPKLPRHISWFKFNQKLYHNKFLCLYKLSQCTSWCSRAIPVKVFFNETISCSYPQLSHTGLLQLQEFALAIGLGWVSTGICSCPNGKIKKAAPRFGRVKSPLGREKSPFGRAKVAHSFFPSESYTQFQKKT